MYSQPLEKPSHYLSLMLIVRNIHTPSLLLHGASSWVYGQQVRLEAFWCAAYDAVSMQKQLEIDFAIAVLLFLSISSIRNARLNILQCSLGTGSLCL